MARGWAAGGVVRKGHSLVMRRMVRGVAPVLVRVRVWVAVWPEVTWPKLRMLPGEMGAGDGEGGRSRCRSLRRSRGR